VQAPAGPFTATSVAFAHQGFEPARQQNAATERAAENDLASGDTFTPGAKLHGEVIQERAPGRRPDPLSDLPETSARATGELETPDSSTEMRDWTMRRQVPARSGYNTRLPGLGTPAASRGPAKPVHGRRADSTCERQTAPDRAAGHPISALGIGSKLETAREIAAAAAG
jgi:hypothetical protein